MVEFSFLEGAHLICFFAKKQIKCAPSKKLSKLPKELFETYRLTNKN